MSKQISLKYLEPLIRETLEKGGIFPILPNGQSMLPFLRPGADEVFLSPLPEKIVSGDIILYKRVDGTFVLHRVMEVKDSLYTFCGDGQIIFEKDIKKDQMIAFVAEVVKDGKKIDLTSDKKYLAYKKRLVAIKKVNFFIYRVKAKLKSMFGL